MSDARPVSPFDAPGRSRGWTLIEALVALVLVAILLSLAVPSYRHYLLRGHRAEAARALLAVTACQERIRAATGFYDLTRCIDNPDGAAYRLSLEPEGVERSLVYEAVARPVRTDPSDACGALIIDQKGTRGIGGDAGRLAACWGGR